MRADPAREPDQDVCHLLAYSKGGASTPENLALGGSKLNRAVGANSLGPMAAMLGAVTAAKALLGSAAAREVELDPEDAHDIAKEGEAHAIKALMAARPFTPSKPEHRAKMAELEQAAKRQRR